MPDTEVLSTCVQMERRAPILTVCGESGSDEVGGARGLEGVGTGQELGPGLWTASKVLGHLGLALCGRSYQRSLVLE